MMIDDYQEDELDDTLDNLETPKIDWYLINSDGNFVKTWNFIICWTTIYNLIMVPFILTFPDSY